MKKLTKQIGKLILKHQKSVGAEQSLKMLKTMHASVELLSKIREHKIWKTLFIPSDFGRIGTFLKKAYLNEFSNWRPVGGLELKSKWNKSLKMCICA